jgi:HK97 family phage portal protein
VNVTPATSLQLITVYGCVRLICDSIATLPLDVYRATADGEKIEVTPPAWIKQPQADIDRVAWVTQVLSSLLLHGNAYVAVLYGPTSIVELVPLDPGKVQVRREQGRKVFYVNGQPAPVQIKHIPGLMLAGSDVGLSPVEYARQSIGLGMSAQEYGARFFGQGATVPGVIESPTPLPPEGPGSAKEIARAWARAHSGKNKAHLPGVLEGGLSWKSIGITNEQAQFLETRKFTAAEIAGQMFLIDPTDLGIPVDGTSLTYANLEQRNARRVQVTLLPWIIRVENALSSLLAQPRYVKFNVNGLLRGDLKTRYESYNIGIRAGFLGSDEARQFEDLPPREDLPPPMPQSGGTANA